MIKVGDMTIDDIAAECASHRLCEDCPFNESSVLCYLMRDLDKLVCQE